MTRQHTNPVIVDATGAVTALRHVALDGVGTRIDEGQLQQLIEQSPSVLPLAEIDRQYAGAVHICREMSTTAGRVDNVLVTKDGGVVLVECKLWRNPQARREVVGQILDYAAEISRYTCADLQREVNRALRRSGDTVFELVRERFPDVDQIAFNDSLTRNLRTGRMMLLIVGDGIREGVETIAEYLVKHSGLNFTLGLVELPMFELPDRSIVVTPRVVAQTTIINRTVFQGGRIDEENDIEFVAEAKDLGELTAKESRELTATGEEARRFWAEFLDGLELDDPNQPKPKPSGTGHIRFSLPVAGAWLRVYRNLADNCVGLFLGSTPGTLGEELHDALIEQWDESIGHALDLIDPSGETEPEIFDRTFVESLEDPADRAEAFEWLRARTNDFVNVLRSEIPTIFSQR
jgi:hypothetical protein